MTRLYAYCVVPSGSVQSSEISGLSGKSVYTVAASDLAAVVSEFEHEAVPVTRNNIQAHQQVIKTIMEQRTPLPFRFGTVVNDNALTSFLIARHAALLKKSLLVEGCMEMSIKVIWQEHAKVGKPEGVQQQTDIVGAGTAFLLNKARQLAGNEALVEEANRISAWLKDELNPVVREACFTVRPSHRLVLAADCLVERSNDEGYRIALERVKTQRPDLYFLTSGPWPPYSFANIDLEFKTQFGVS